MSSYHDAMAYQVVPIYRVGDRVRQAVLAAPPLATSPFEWAGSCWNPDVSCAGSKRSPRRSTELLGRCLPNPLILCTGTIPECKGPKGSGNQSFTMQGEKVLLGTIRSAEGEL